MPFTWITGPQQPLSPEPEPIPSNAISHMVGLVANTVNAGGVLVYNTVDVKYDVIYPTTGNVTIITPSNTWNTLNASFANLTVVSANNSDIFSANINALVSITITANTLNNATLYFPTIVNGTASANPTAPLGIATKQYVDDHMKQSLTESTPIGQLSFFGQRNLPNGWISCNTSNISRSTNSNLFNIVSTIWGVGDGVSTFDVPYVQSSIMPFRFLSNTAQTQFHSHTTTVLPDSRILKIGGGKQGVTAAFSNVFFGAIGSNSIQWIEATPLPTPIRNHTTLTISSNLVLVIGGFTGTVASNATYFGHIDGTSITWVTSNTLPQPRYSFGSALLHGKAIVYGGINTAGFVQNTFYIGTITGNNISWANNATAFPRLSSDYATISIPDGSLISVGIRDSGVARDNVIFGHLTKDRTLMVLKEGRKLSQAFTSTSNARFNAAVCSLPGGRVFVTGGHDGTTPRSNSLIGKVSNTAVAWNESIPLPKSLFLHTMNYIPNSNLIIVIGGHDGTTHTGDVWVSRLLTSSVKA